ncbi:ATP-dependent DNA helicase RecG [Acidihalobacter aeolianus]|uniref:ATP-dependent DNA helicase RecG n=1 Tax=Acidihalobacter aeolianus TaxID=2792603 RepID=A0A1D8KB96_9GAMM|nr:ATP-dependent DNA helicase RecG [Acidihalobacter aeolianus]AOV18229.1 ATP-dependent DNA helicase RecG [Acidihalobacter aeolianus]
MTALGLQSPVAAMKGVGERLAERLTRLGIERVEDLLFHLPLRYQDRSRLHPLGGLRPQQEVLIQGQVLHAEVVVRRRRALLVRLGDQTGQITLRFFHFGSTQRNQLVTGQWVRAFGEARAGVVGLEMVHPEYRILAEPDGEPLEQTLTPVYPATEGVGQATLRRLIGLARAYGGLHDWLPVDRLPDTLRYGLAEAIELIHAPPVDADTAALLTGRHPAQRRLAFEELVAHQLGMARLRAEARTENAPPLPAPTADSLCARFVGALPFALTGAQQRVMDEIAADLSRAHPMLRLVQGDVGSGKTVVAVAACLQAVAGGYQAAMMAPTELLAEQHYRNAERWLAPLGVRVVWLSGRQRETQRSEVLAELADGRAAVTVGTHALFQEAVRFARLGLVVIDEQHRFGVHQRLALREKAADGGWVPHQLVMTATPIPRTLAMTAYADLDYSVIDELPPGREPVVTVAIPDTRRSEIVERINAAVGRGQQVYWVCTLIEESEALQCETAEATYALLTETLPAVAVGLVHGRLKAADKEAVMRAFQQGELDLLVATTVIEVGVDVPNASLMVIENAERLGLAQLHQLRGRVGRGTAASSCVLLYHPPLGETARRRLQVMRETGDGFEVARHDLEIRGPGELLGTRQTGLARLRVADMAQDADLIPAALQLAHALASVGSAASDALIRRWVAGGIRYAQV